MSSHARHFSLSLSMAYMTCEMPISVIESVEAYCIVQTSEGKAVVRQGPLTRPFLDFIGPLCRCCFILQLGMVASSWTQSGGSRFWHR